MGSLRPSLQPKRRYLTRSNPFSTPFRAPVTAKTKVPSQTGASTIQKHHRPGLDVGRRQALRGLEGEANAVLGKAEEAG
ncbi:hypothetical protein TthHB5008_20230 [Thermus thermophilus]|nr:hypothetical protein TthHB5002_20250 [Thermus thermophilus]BCQ01253.1 hypothetical protein TthHB5008_20230 [Thermus thermophilus]